MLITADHSLFIGGADRDRTDDLRLAKPALSQLSYSPENNGLCEKFTFSDSGLPANDRSTPRPSLPFLLVIAYSGRID